MSVYLFDPDRFISETDRGERLYTHYQTSRRSDVNTLNEGSEHVDNIKPRVFSVLQDFLV